jgi:hypothetical protein
MNTDSYDDGTPYRYEGGGEWTPMPHYDLNMTIVEYTTPLNRPVIAIGPRSITHNITQGDNLPRATFTVRNAGSGRLNYAISEAYSWLSVSPGLGTSTGETDTITIAYYTALLGPGSHTAAISVADPNAANSSQTVTVTVNVADPAATLSCSPISLTPKCNAGGYPANGSFAVRNGGGGAMSYTITDDQPWMYVTPEDGTSPGDSDTINISYDTSSLPVGTYTGTITIASDQADKSVLTINVTLSVFVPPDFDQDGDVDLNDYGFFQSCFNGPSRPAMLPDVCDPADIDGDGDVDLSDFNRLQRCFSGPGRPTDPVCAD